MSDSPPGAHRDTGTAVIDVVAAAQLACLLEVSAPKPGNVAPGRRFHDMGIEDFLASAAALAGPLRAVAQTPLGRTIRRAVDATAGWTRANTNLGIVLLLAPLARAAAQMSDQERTPPSPEAWPATLRQMAGRVLESTTIEDTRDVYAAIRRASPGGLSTSSEQDVANEPTMPLLAVMRLAADRDDVAREYATAFEITFGTGVPSLARARQAGLSWDDAIVETYLVLLAARPDTHVRRRAGEGAAAEVSRLAAAALDAGGVRTEAGRRTIDEMDCELRGPGHPLNPGTTADLTTAAIFVVLVSGGWHDRAAGDTASAQGPGGRDAATR